MNKYRLKPQIVDAQLYEKGMEDGWRLYWSYENYCYEPLETLYVTFKSLEAIEIRKKDMYSNADTDNPILFEEPVPVLQTINGLEEISKNDYIVINEKGEKRLINKVEFEDIFEKIHGFS